MVTKEEIKGISSRAMFITTLFYLLIITVCFMFMFSRPITYQYIETDRQPGLTIGDRVVSTTIGGFALEQAKLQPNFFAGLIAVLAISTLGFCYSISKWDKLRKIQVSRNSVIKI